MFRCGAENGEDCISYFEMKIHKRFSDAFSWTELCDRDAS